MANSKSPFMVFRDFLSPKECEQIAYKLNFNYPDIDPQGTPIPSLKREDWCEDFVFERWELIIPQITTYYNIDYDGTEPIIFEWYPTESSGNPICENSTYNGRKWMRTLPRDVSAVLFLSDFNDEPGFEETFEVYGGKLEFPSHGFGFNPERGTLIVYPSVPHFINITSKILVGELIQTRIQLSATQPFLYDPSLFPGTYREWFK